MNFRIEALIKVFISKFSNSTEYYAIYYDNYNREILIAPDYIWHYRRNKMTSAFILYDE